ncbi:Uncharacterized protein PCOAH_00008550 [Plasmodium coatneyi]|uniref:Uncharacterized protein n=1 Tax=Plasmodium coatneyi TaxID=208452 RepID=A0A1B1DUL0_9APIC|nr:Uncharacterized protein PCOAH_00008550 [Plasmodium coatneyi]ANQ06470.1 Uncharacterized protein PCOAH_00008550 [Plasmodium coatneyi]
MTEGHKESVDENPYKEDPIDCYKEEHEEHEKNELDKYLIKVGDITAKSNFIEKKGFCKSKYDLVMADSNSTTTEEVSCPFPLEGKGYDKDTMQISEEGEYGNAFQDLLLDDQQSTKVGNGESSGRSGSSSGRSSGGRSEGGGTGNGSVSSSIGKNAWPVGNATESARKMDAPKFSDDKDLYPVANGKLTRSSEPFLISTNEMSKGKENQCDNLSAVKTPTNGSIADQTNGTLNDYASVQSGKENEHNNHSPRQNTHVTELPNEGTNSLRQHVYPSYVSNPMNPVNSRNNALHMFNGPTTVTTVGGQKNLGPEGDYTRMILRGNSNHTNCVHKSGNKNGLNVLHLKNGGRCAAHGVSQESRGGSPSVGSAVKVIRGTTDLERFVGSVNSGRSINGVINQEVTQNGEIVRNVHSVRSASSWRGTKGGTHSLAFNGVGNNLRNVSRTENLKSSSRQNSGMYHLSVRMNKLRSSTAVFSDPGEAPPLLAVKTMPPVQVVPSVQTITPVQVIPTVQTVPPVQVIPTVQTVPLLHGTHPIHANAPSTPKNPVHLLEGNLNYNPKVEDKKKLTNVSGGDVKLAAMTNPHVKSSVENANVRLNLSRPLIRGSLGGGHAVVDSFRESPHRVGRNLNLIGVSFDRDIGPHFQGVVIGPSGGRVPCSAIPIRGDPTRGIFHGGINGGVSVNVNVPFSGPFSGIVGRDFPVHTCKGGGGIKSPSDTGCGGSDSYGSCATCATCGMVMLKNLSSRQRGLTGPYKKVNEETCNMLKGMVRRRHFIGYNQMNNWIGPLESKCRGKIDWMGPSAASSRRSSGIFKPNEKVNKEKEMQLLDIMIKEANKTLSEKKKKNQLTKFEIKAFLLNTLKAIGIVQAKWKLKDFGMHFWFHIKSIEKERDLNFYVKFFDSLFQIITGKGIHFQPNDVNLLVNLFKEFHIYDCKNIFRTSLKVLNRYAKRNFKDFSILDNAEDILDVNKALLQGMEGETGGGGADTPTSVDITPVDAAGGDTSAGTPSRAPPSSNNFFDFLFSSIKENHDALQKVGQEKLYLSNIFANFNELNYGQLFHLFMRK